MPSRTRTWQAPPNWPTPPAGWSPPPGWQPDPNWGPPPPGWTFWSIEHDTADTSGPAAPPPGATVLGHRADRQYGRMLSQLGPHLEAGETVTAFFLANTLRTLVNSIAVTDRRVLAWNSSDLARKPPRISLRGEEIESFSLERSAVNRLPRLLVKVLGAEPVLVGQLLSRNDENLLGEAVKQLQLRSAPAGHVTTGPPTARPVHREAVAAR